MPSFLSQTSHHGPIRRLPCVWSTKSEGPTYCVLQLSICSSDGTAGALAVWPGSVASACAWHAPGRKHASCLPGISCRTLHSSVAYHAISPQHSQALQPHSCLVLARQGTLGNRPSMVGKSFNQDQYANFPCYQAPVHVLNQALTEFMS